MSCHHSEQPTFSYRLPNINVIKTRPFNVILSESGGGRAPCEVGFVCSYKKSSCVVTRWLFVAHTIPKLKWLTEIDWLQPRRMIYRHQVHIKMLTNPNVVCEGDLLWFERSMASSPDNSSEWYIMSGQYNRCRCSGTTPQYPYCMMTHLMKKNSALLAICEHNSPVTGEFPTQRPVTRSFDVSFDLRLN